MVKRGKDKLSSLAVFREIGSESRSHPCTFKEQKWMHCFPKNRSFCLCPLVTKHEGQERTAVVGTEVPLMASVMLVSGKGNVLALCLCNRVS